MILDVSHRHLVFKVPEELRKYIYWNRQIIKVMSDGVAEGALDKFKQWKKISYISYNYLRKAWQKVLLDIFREKFSEDQKVKNLIRYYYHKYTKGFYVNAETRMRSARHAARYVGRY